MNTKLMFSKKSDLWVTPDVLFNALNEEFKFTLDVAADESNHKCELWLGPGGLVEDALSVSWDGVCWMNPPYSQVGAFIEKAAAERLLGVTTVALIPARTDTKYWHQHIWDYEHVNKCRAYDGASTLWKDGTWRQGVRGRFLKGRVKFVNPESTRSNSAPFPSAVIIFHGN